MTGSPVELPTLVLASEDGILWQEDPNLRTTSGVVIAFSERTGGVSGPPFTGLNLGHHVGDDPHAVDENRSLFLRALGLGSMTGRLVVADQVHGLGISVITDADAGRGASAMGGPGPVSSTDAMITAAPGVPLLMCFADCVPVLLVAPGPAVAVVHAGWRGALGKLPGTTARRLAEYAGCEAGALTAYVGTHICPSHYEVSTEIMSQFFNAFGTVARADSRGLDLGAVVRADLVEAGVPSCSIASLGLCTAEETGRYFSHRAERGHTGRHGALACILPPSS